MRAVAPLPYCELPLIFEDRYVYMVWRGKLFRYAYRTDRGTWSVLGREYPRLREALVKRQTNRIAMRLLR